MPAPSLLRTTLFICLLTVTVLFINSCVACSLCKGVCMGPCPDSVPQYLCFMNISGKNEGIAWDSEGDGAQSCGTHSAVFNEVKYVQHSF